METIIIESKKDGARSYFPFHRWIRARDKMYLMEFDSCLPADDKNPKQRAKELERMRTRYQMAAKIPGLPYQVICPLNAMQSMLHFFPTCFHLDLIIYRSSTCQRRRVSLTTIRLIRRYLHILIFISSVNSSSLDELLNSVSVC